ncbi:hypothetical protein L484_009915 [Morus notabilis]|uniref:Uncharacterized protein n=1 Tax=Morus notabilis TaxID=981085 RepID=W9QC08_9ROSA|nr:hypothetical protein L484_009915 [Morus notabilis]
MADNEDLREIVAEDQEEEWLDEKLDEVKKEKANLEATFKKLQHVLCGKERKLLLAQKENEELKKLVEFLKESEICRRDVERLNFLIIICR